jgi:anaphase-promoting complex subunit 1
MPTTFHHLEYVRPAFLLQKVICKNLILWDKIEATREWVESQVPELIRDIFEHDIAYVEKRYA